MQLIISLLTIALVFAGIDAVWLKLSSRFYRKEIGGLLRTRPDFIAATLFYGLYVCGIAFFAVMPALSHQSALVAVSYGALLGLMNYATYDLTNLATIQGWSKRLVIIDIVWGTIATAAAAILSYLILHMWLGY